MYDNIPQIPVTFILKYIVCHHRYEWASKFLEIKYKSCFYYFGIVHKFMMDIVDESYYKV